jgi:hypothetical protein
MQDQQAPTFYGSKNFLLVYRHLQEKTSVNETTNSQTNFISLHCPKQENKEKRYIYVCIYI